MTESAALDERAQRQNGLPATRPPSHAGAFEPFGDQSLARRLHDAGTDGQCPGLGIGVAHSVAIATEVAQHLCDSLCKSVRRTESASGLTLSLEALGQLLPLGGGTPHRTPGTESLRHDSTRLRRIEGRRVNQTGLRIGRMAFFVRLPLHGSLPRRPPAPPRRTGPVCRKGTARLQDENCARCRGVGNGCATARTHLRCVPKLLPLRASPALSRAEHHSLGATADAGRDEPERATREPRAIHARTVVDRQVADHRQTNRVL